MLTVEKQWINVQQKTFTKWYIFCCTLIHCFSTVNIFDHGGDIQGRLAMSGDDSELS
jgi:hypothetical protein